MPVLLEHVWQRQVGDGSQQLAGRGQHLRQEAVHHEGHAGNVGRDIPMGERHPLWCPSGPACVAEAKKSNLFFKLYRPITFGLPQNNAFTINV